MRILALDSSGPALSAAVADGGEVGGFHHETLGRGHAERVLPVLEAVLAAAGWRWADIELIAATTGPGNFTGLRAGISVARALSLALRRPTLGVGTLEAVAQAAYGAGTAGRRSILAAMDARRDEVYSQRFDPDLAPLTPPELLSSKAVLPGDGAWLVTGDAAAAIVRHPGGEHLVVPATPDARAVAAAAWRRLRRGAVPASGVALRPVYVRAPDARPGAGASLVAAPGSP